MRSDFIDWLNEQGDLISDKLRTAQSYISFIRQIPDLGNRMKAQQLNSAGDFKGVLQILRAYNINPVSTTTIAKGPSLPATPSPRPLGPNPFGS